MVLCVANPFGILQEVPMEDIVFMKRHHRVSHMWIYMEPAVIYSVESLFLTIKDTPCENVMKNFILNHGLYKLS